MMPRVTGDKDCHTQQKNQHNQRGEEHHQHILTSWPLGRSAVFVLAPLARRFAAH